MEMLQIVYSSQPFGYDAGMLIGILLDARRCNTRNDVTGALICRDDIYLQLLEGPELAVRATLDRIKRDDRHLNVVEHMNRKITDRMFGRWAMLDDPATSWLWPRDRISDGVPVGATTPQILAVFERLAREKADE